MPGDLIASLTERAADAAQSWRPGAKVRDVRTLTGGASSLTFTADVEVGGENTSVVLKVAPPGLPPVRNRDVLRQARVMRALVDRPGVFVPRVLFESPGEPPEVPPFLAMEWVAGECHEPVLTAVDRRDPGSLADIRSRALDATRVLASIHALAPAELGLATEPVVGLGDEIDRWARALETVSPELSEGTDRVADALRETMPAPLPPVVNHGDYRLGNTLCLGAHVTSVIDWEIWSVGDPRVDVTWLTYFCDDQQHPAAPDLSVPSGMPTTTEVLAEYVAARGWELPDLAWFQALTRYKETGATALLIKRARKAGIVDPTMERMAPALPRMLDEAMHLLGWI